MTYFRGLGPLSATGTHNPKYLNQFWMVLHETFTTGLVFVRQSKQGVTTLCFNHNYT